MTIHDLDVKRTGITLSLQHMDLLDIVSAKNTNELKQRTYAMKNFTIDTLNNIFISPKSLQSLKNDCFFAYKNTLISYSYYHYDNYGYLFNNLKLIEYIKETIDLTDDEYQKIDELKYIKNKKKIISFIKHNFSKHISQYIFDVQLMYMTIEKDGIKITSYESFEKLYEEFKKYNVINCDEITSYRSAMTLDGRYRPYRLQRAMDFAKRHGKTLRLDALIFYMDTPNWIYSLRKNQKNHDYVYEHILEYTDNVVATIKEFNTKNNTNIAETITLLNEPLNRFPGPFEARYSLRGNISKHFPMVIKTWLKNDNYAPGWLLFLNIEDIYNIGKHIKEQLNIKLMFNECYLESQHKLKIFINEVIKPIRDLEDQNNEKIIDLIGTQLHTDVDVPIYSIEESFEMLSEQNIPFEITELDIFVSPDKIRVSSIIDINLYKSWYVHDVYKLINKYSTNINVVTIWSINDDMNFMINIMNNSIYKTNLYRNKHNLKELPYLTNILGGYYNTHMNERIYLPEMDNE